MVVSFQDARENLAFAAKCIREVAKRRKNEQVIAACEKSISLLQNVSSRYLGSEKMLERIGNQLQWSASDLLVALKFEMREVLIPFLEVKEPTHEFGLLMFPDYFQWLSDGECTTPGDLVKFLEEDMEKLSVALEHIARNHESTSRHHR